MLLSLITSLILTQFFSPSIAHFEQEVALKQALQGSEQIVAQAPVRVNEGNLGPKITSQSAVVIDQQSRKVLYQSNLHARRPIASISKLMTAVVFLEQNPDLGAEFTITRDDVAGEGVQYVSAGETVTLKDLLFMSLIASDNNAASALIRASGLSHDDFITRMNTKAVELGMYNTRFIEPTGLYYANISSAQDVALMLEAALSHAVIADILPRTGYSFTAVSGKEHRVNSTNKLLDSYLDVLGGKTGYNDEAQFNFTSAIRGDKGQVLLIVSLGSSDQDARFDDVKVMADWSLRNYIWP